MLNAGSGPKASQTAAMPKIDRDCDHRCAEQRKARTKAGLFL